MKKIKEFFKILSKYFKKNRTKMESMDTGPHRSSNLILLIQVVLLVLLVSLAGTLLRDLGLELLDQVKPTWGALVKKQAQAKPLVAKALKFVLATIVVYPGLIKSKLKPLKTLEPGFAAVPVFMGYPLWYITEGYYLDFKFLLTVKGVQKYTLTQSETRTTIVTEKGGLQMPVKWLAEYKIVNPRQSYLISEVAENWLDALEGEINKALSDQVLLEISTEGDTPSFTVNTKLAGEGFITDYIIKTNKKLVGLNYEGAITGIRVAISDITIPDQYKEIAQKFFQERADTLSKEEQRDAVKGYASDLIGLGVPQDLAADIAAAAYDENHVSRVNHVGVSNADSYLLALIQALRGGQSK